MYDLKNELLPGLPAFCGGRMSDAAYNAGMGLHPLGAEGLIQAWETDYNNLEFLQDLERYIIGGLDANVRTFGKNQMNILLTNGRMQWEIKKNGFNVRQCLSCCNPDEKADEPSLARAVTQTTFDAFAAYLDELAAMGFVRSWERVLDGNTFAEMKNGGRRIYCEYMARANTARFIDDRVSADLSAFDVKDTPKIAEPVICQYGLHYGEMHSGVTADCGMLYIIRLCDNSLFMIDGGELSQATDRVIDDILRQMHELTGTADGEKMRVAGWFCTHAHDDHVDLFAKLLRMHHAEIDLERIIFNFPADDQFEQVPAIYSALDRLTAYYPNAAYLKPHAGQCFEMGGVQFDILQTHEDSVGPLGTEKIGGFNDTSTILKVTYEGASFLFLGDMDEDSEALLFKHYSDEAVRGSGVQVAHHLINELHRVYRSIAPETAVVPQHEVFMERYPVREKMLLDVLKRENIYFASNGTDLFEPKDGRWVHTRHIETPQEPFDGSFL